MLSWLGNMPHVSITVMHAQFCRCPTSWLSLTWLGPLFVSYTSYLLSASMLYICIYADGIHLYGTPFSMPIHVGGEHIYPDPGLPFDMINSRLCDCGWIWAK